MKSSTSGSVKFGSSNSFYPSALDGKNVWTVHFPENVDLHMQRTKLINQKFV